MQGLTLQRIVLNAVALRKAGFFPYVRQQLSRLILEGFEKRMVIALISNCVICGRYTLPEYQFNLKAFAKIIEIR